jgi:hypothetical protein
MARLPRALRSSTLLVAAWQQRFVFAARWQKAFAARNCHNSSTLRLLSRSGPWDGLSIAIAGFRQLAHSRSSTAAVATTRA